MEVPSGHLNTEVRHSMEGSKTHTNGESWEIEYLRKEMNRDLEQDAIEEEELRKDMDNDIQETYAKLRGLKKEVEEVVKLGKEASYPKAIENIAEYADGVEDKLVGPYQKVINRIKDHTELNLNIKLIETLIRPETSNQGPRLPARPKVWFRLGPLHVSSTPKKTQHTSNDVKKQF